MRGQKHRNQVGTDEIVFWLIEGDPVCVYCAWELRASGGSPVWWKGHVLPVSDQMLITEPWTAALGTVACRHCGSILLVSEEA